MEADLPRRSASGPPASQLPCIVLFFVCVSGRSQRLPQKLGPETAARGVRRTGGRCSQLLTASNSALTGYFPAPAPVSSGRKPSLTWPVRGDFTMGTRERSDTVNQGRRRLLSTAGAGCRRLCRRRQRVSCTGAAIDLRRGRLPRRWRPGSSRPRDGMAQQRAADGREPARQGRSHRFLDLHLHQLAAHGSLCARLGREVPGSRAGRHRCAHAGVSGSTRFASTMFAAP